MKTEVNMQRKLFNETITQKSKTGYFSANDLIKAGNKYRATNGMPLLKLQDWINRDTTKEFVKELESQLGVPVKIASRGRSGITWLHPFLFIDLALTISPKLKIEVYSWLYDELLKYRNDSGDSYKKMCGALYENAKNKSEFHKNIKIVSNLIRNACKVKTWEEATEHQLKIRDRIHENIALLTDVLKDNQQAVRLGIVKAINNDITQSYSNK